MIILELLEEKAATSVEINERLMILTCLLGLQAELKAPSRRGGSKNGRRNIKDCHRMACHLMPEAHHIADERTHGSSDFWQRFGMKEVFMCICTV